MGFLKGHVDWLIDLIGWALGKFIECVSGFTISAGNVAMFVAVHIEYVSLFSSYPASG